MFASYSPNTLLSRDFPEFPRRFSPCATVHRMAKWRCATRKRIPRFSRRAGGLSRDRRSALRCRRSRRKESLHVGQRMDDELSRSGRAGLPTDVGRRSCAGDRRGRISSQTVRQQYARLRQCASRTVRHRTRRRLCHELGSRRFARTEVARASSSTASPSGP